MTKSIRRFGRVFFVPAFAVIVGACAPAGYGNVGNTYVRWPTQDEQLPAENLLEVEVILNSLGYSAGRADGAITTDTRAAIRRFQADIGAPVTGFISPTLLAALRVNAGLGATALQAVTVAQSSGGNSTGGSDSGGGRGGSGSGGWN